MQFTLILDTSTERGFVALAQGVHLFFIELLPVGTQSSRWVLSVIEKGFQILNIKAADIDKIIVSTGPGLFTGIRVGVAVAKGLSFAQSIPLMGFNALHGFTTPADGLFWSVIDLRMGGVATLLQERKEGTVRPLSAPEACSIEYFVAAKQQELPVVGPSLGRLSIPRATESAPDIHHLVVFLEKHQGNPAFVSEDLSISYLRPAV